MTGITPAKLRAEGQLLDTIRSNILEVLQNVDTLYCDEGLRYDEAWWFRLDDLLAEAGIPPLPEVGFRYAESLLPAVDLSDESGFRQFYKVMDGEVVHRADPDSRKLAAAVKASRSGARPQGFSMP